MTNYAAFDYKTADLSTEFGDSYARKIFGDEAIDSLPKYVRGPKKGKAKGYISWAKVARGGWVRGGFDGGYVENRVGSCIDHEVKEMLYPHGHRVHLDNTQTLENIAAQRLLEESYKEKRLQNYIECVKEIRADMAEKNKNPMVQTDKILRNILAQHYWGKRQEARKWA